MAGERLQPFETIDTPTLRLADEFYVWRASPKSPEHNGQCLAIFKSGGIIRLWGETTYERQFPWGETYEACRRLTWQDQATRDLYRQTVVLLGERGIDIPRPDPKYQSLEQLIATLDLSERTEIDPEQSPFMSGQPIIFDDVRYFDPREEGRTSKVLYIGKVDPNYKAGAGGYIQSRAQRVDFEQVWRIEYEHFTPAEQHITGVYQWNPRLFLAKGDYNRSKWKPLPYSLSQESFDVIQKEADKTALLYDKYPQVQLAKVCRKV